MDGSGFSECGRLEWVGSFLSLRERLLKMDGYGGSSERVCVCVGASKIINGMNPLDVQREFYI